MISIVILIACLLIVMNVDLSHRRIAPGAIVWAVKEPIEIQNRSMRGKTPERVNRFMWRIMGMPLITDAMGDIHTIRLLDNGSMRLSTADMSALYRTYYDRLMSSAITLTGLVISLILWFPIFIPLSNYTWNQTSGNLATGSANWNDDAFSVGFTRPSPVGAGPDRVFGTPQHPVVTRLSSGRVIAVLVDITANQDLMVYYSDDDWTNTTRVLIDTTLNHLHSAIAVSGTDKLYVISRSDTNVVILYSSSDNGATWVASTDIAAGEPNTPTNNVQVCIDDDNFLHLAWQTNTSNDIRYAMSDTVNPNADEFNSGGTPWDIESYSGAADSSSESIASGFTFGSDSHWNIHLADRAGAGNFTVAVSLDGTPGSQNEVRFKSKNHDVAWGSGSGTQVFSGTNVHLPAIAVAFDDQTWVMYFKAALKPSVIASVDGGATWGARFELVISSGGNGNVTYDGTYFWVSHGLPSQIFYSQLLVDPITAAITRVGVSHTEITGTNGGNVQVNGALRSHRFHRTSPEFVDLVYIDVTDTRHEAMVIASQIPRSIDNVFLDGTSSANMTWDISTPIVSYSQNVGYGGLVNCTEILDVTGGAIIHNAGGLQMDNGFSCDTFTNLTSTLTVTRARKNCIATTSLRVEGNTSFEFSALTGDATLTCPSVVSNGLFGCQDNTVFDCILQGPDNSTYQDWVTGIPFLDISGSGSTVVFGSPGTNRGPNINNATFNHGTGTLKIDNRSEFNNLTFGTGTIDGVAGRIVMGGNWDSTAGLWKENTGAVQWSVSGSVSMSASQGFNDLEIDDGITLTLLTDTAWRDQIQMNSTGIIDFNGLILSYDGTNAIVVILGTGTFTHSSAASAILFEPDNALIGIPGRTDYPQIRFADNTVNDSQISMTGAIICEGLVSTPTTRPGTLFDLSGFNLTVNGNLGGSNPGTVDATTVVLIDVVGDIDTSGWIMSNNAPITYEIVSGSNSINITQTVDNITLTSSGTTTLLSDLTLTGVIDHNSSGILSFNGNDIILTAASGTQWINSVGSVMSGAGFVRYEPSSGSATFSVGGNYPNLTIGHNVNSILSGSITANITAFQLTIGLPGGAVVTVNTLVAVDSITLTSSLIVQDSGTFNFDGNPTGQTIDMQPGQNISITGIMKCTVTGGDDITIQGGAAITVNAAAEFVIAALGSTGSTIVITDFSLSCAVGATLNAQGPSSAERITIDNRVFLTGDASTFILRNFNVTSSGTAIEIDVAQTGTFALDTCNFTSSAGAGMQVDAGSWNTAPDNSGNGDIDDCIFRGLNVQFDLYFTNVNTSMHMRTTSATNDTVRGVSIIVSTTFFSIYNTTTDFFDLWGTANLSVDHNVTELLVSSATVVRVRNNAGGGADSNLTVDSWSGSARRWQCDLDTKITNPSGFTFLVANLSSFNQSIGTLFVEGIFNWNPSLNNGHLYIYNGIQLNLASSVWSSTRSAGNSEMKLADDTLIRIGLGAVGASVTLSGMAFDHMTDAGPGDFGGPFSGANAYAFIFDNAPSLSVTDCTMLEMGTLTYPNSIEFGNDSYGTFARNNCESDSFIAVNLVGFNSWNPTADLNFVNCRFFHGFSGSLACIAAVVDPEMKFDSCYFGRGFPTLLTPGTPMQGSFKNCYFKSEVALADNVVVNSDINVGTITDSRFESGLGVTFDISSAAIKVELLRCYFDELDVGTPGLGSYLISYLHDNVNNKEVVIVGDPNVDASFTSVVNSDGFPWDMTYGDWFIDSNKRFRSIGSSSTPLISDFFPVVNSSTYHFDWIGNIATATVREYDASLTEISNAVVAKLGTFITDPTTVFMTIEFIAAAADEDVGKIKVRDTDINGQIIFAETNTNAYENVIGATTEIFYDLNKLTWTDSATAENIYFGDLDYNALTSFIVEIDNIDQNINKGGVTVAMQSSSADRYDVFIDTAAGVATLKVVKYISNSGTLIFQATTVNSGTTIISTLTGTADKLEARWQDPGDETGSFRVLINDNLIETGPSGDWLDAGSVNILGSDNYVVDTLYTQGSIGLYGSTGIGIPLIRMDNMLVEHEGLFMRDVDLTVLSTPIITKAAGGIIDFKRGTANISRTAVEGLGTLIEEDVAWADTDFDENVNGVIILSCAKIQVEGNIVLGLNGQLIATGCIFEHVDSTQGWTIVTENSIVDPPMIIDNCLFRNLNARFTPLIGAIEEPYEITQFPSVISDVEEIVLNGPEPDHPVDRIRHPVWSRQSYINTIKGHGNQSVTLDFVTFDSNCLYGKLFKWRKNDVILSVLWPRGWIHKCTVDDLDGGPVNAGMTVLEFEVTLEEFS